MIPLLASGAASLANVLVNRVAGSSSASGGNVTLDAKAFERALSKAAGNRSNPSPAEQQAAALTQRLMQSPEMEAALTAHPVGSVGGVEVRQDGSVFLQTAQGAVAVQLSLEGRELARQAYAASVVTGGAGVTGLSGVAASGGVQPTLQIPLQGVGAR
jgi:hypothetical protein